MMKYKKLKWNAHDYKIPFPVSWTRMHTLWVDGNEIKRTSYIKYAAENSNVEIKS